MHLDGRGTDSLKRHLCGLVVGVFARGVVGKQC